LSTIDEYFAGVERYDSVDTVDAFYQRAYAMMSSPQAREAFSVKSEPQSLREAYGLNPAGQRLLLARRLVEGGVRFVSVNYGSWDHHGQLRGGILKELPPFDQAFAALITDMDQRGLLESTLVVVSSDFGRTPKVNSDAGRDHWPKCFTVVLAGGGVKRGYVHGASDAIAAEPVGGAVAVEDFAATIFHLLGISVERRLMAFGNRPMRIGEGKVVKELLA
jgi:uncharacterized protein (DUF1501 family)